MSEFLDSLPSAGQMFKLIVFLIMALIVLGLVAALVKAMLPILFLAAIVAGGYYLFNKWQENNR